jgi:molecular chaperone DnaJ
LSSSRSARDFYEILGVDRDATQDEIKSAYRRLARETHPDVRRDDPQATERFKEVNEAYAVLSDPQKRSDYDRYGHVGRSEIGDPFAGVAGPFGDLFDMFFGGRTATTRADPNAPERGSDLRVDIEVTLEEVATGVERRVAVERLETCPGCFGTGAERGAAPERCPTCRGSGEVRRTQRTVFGQMTQIGPCPQCGGTGTYIARPCARCRGEGRVTTRREVTVTVPAGIEDGMHLRLTGEGESGARGGGRGDLFVVVHVKPHRVFERRGADLACEVAVSMVQAALGAEIDIATLTGRATLTVPAGTQPGTRLTMRGQGLPDLRGGRGDLKVTVRIEIPRSLTPEQRALLEEFAALSEQRRQGKRRTVLGKVKDLLQ